ncbi:DUF2184 domain-containing protein [Acutalibacter intestini]|uniref:DUF2184 domain-containing protein n=1 Tax=Acutalibacter intestini TaxID=3093659 RepID=UPI002AC8BC17|nr:DUF2184 domain-containing protein [Acutalibacter sp. M00204]
MPIKNMGTTNAGVFSPAFSSTPGAAGVPTLDQAAVASGQAFLVSELEKRDNLLRQPLTSFTYPRDIVIQTGGGWVDYVSAMSVAYGITGGSGGGLVGSAGANGLPIVQASLDKGLYKAHVFAAALRVMFLDMQRSAQLGRSLDQLLQNGIRLAYDKHVDQHVYLGLEEYGTTGILNCPDATETTVPASGASGSTKWKDKTPRQILEDVNQAILAVWEAGEHDESAMPNHILLPYEQYTYLLNTMVTDLATETILDYLQKNNVAAKNGKNLFIGATRWCKGAGTGGSDRMAVYINDARFLKMDELVPMSRIMSGPNAANACYDTAYMANITEPQVFYPQCMAYFDGI